MNDISPADDGSLSLSAALHIDQVCLRFEAAWKDGLHPRIEDYLADATGAVRTALVRELTRLELELRGRAAELERLATASTEPVPPRAPEAPPAVGHGFEILEEIGHGGIGVVHRGRDAGLRRDVAVKVLRDEHWDNADVVRRFVEEAQIGSQLQHPGVVPIYKLGEFADGRPYFTMKLVRGETLADLLERRKGPGEDLPRFTAIFEQVCQTLAYAHSKGVIHRDLKPANVMVGAFGEVQVMDWGLAKVLGHGVPASADGRAGEKPAVIDTLRRDAPNAASQHGMVMGTYAYMPPEQARGEVARLDERCDVFSLGAILCEILTGLPPYAGTPEAVCCMAAAGDLQEAFGRLDSCAADPELARIARSCLAAQPEGRPRDAAAVAKAVTAYLAGVQERLRAVELERAAAQAREAEAKAKAKAERRARRVTVGLAASVLLTAALLGGGGGWLLWRQAETKLAAEADLGAATAAAERGDDQAAREALKRIEGRLAGGGYDELRHRMEWLRRELDFADELEAARMKALETTKDSYGFDWAGADDAYARAFADRGLDVTSAGAAATAERIKGSPVKDRLVTALDAWADVRRLGGVGGWKGLLEVAGRADDSGDEMRRRLREAAVREDTQRLLELASDPGAAGQSAGDALLLSDALLATKERGMAERVLRAAVVRNGGDFWLYIALDNLLRNDASASARAECVGFLRAAVAARPCFAEAHITLGVHLEQQGQPAEAEKEFREALRIRPDLALAHNNLGNLMRDQGQPAEAEKEYREALRIKPDYALAHNNLGALLDGQSQPAAAEKEFREALRIKPDYTEAHYNLGYAMREQGQPAEAEKEFREALRIKPDLAVAHYDLGNIILRDQGRLAEAEKEYREALQIKPDYAEAHCNLGGVLREQGRLREALEELRRGHELGSRDPRWHYPSAAWVKDCQRLVQLDALLPALLRGEAEPSDAAASLDFARVCGATRRNAAAARFYAAAFAADPAWFTGPGVRYDAARAAALAGCGQGDDAPKEDADRAHLRAQALEWLRADLAARRKDADAGGPKGVAAARLSLQHWQEDPALAGVRDKLALDSLPQEEREKWHQFWDEVDALLENGTRPK